MELLYIWIEEYRKIKKQGFNFSSEFIFNYNSENKELLIDKNPNYIPNFFPKEFSNVTAIIGENGSGKSTLLEFIVKILTWSVFQEADKIFVITKSESDYLIEGFEEAISQIKLIDKINLNPQIESYEQRKENTGFSFTHKGKGVVNTKQAQAIIYYANYFDYHRHLPESRSGYWNISTDYLLDKTIKNESAIKSQSRELVISYFIIDETERQIFFINDKPDTKLPFELPTSLNIGLQNRTDRIQESLSDYSQDKLIDTVINTLINAFISYLMEFEGKKEEIIKKINEQSLNADSFTDYGEKVILILKEISNYPPLKNIKIEALREFANYIRLAIKEKKIIVNSNSQVIVTILILKEDENENFLKFYRPLSKVYNFLNLEWSGLSTGEKAFLNLYARFYSVIDNEFRSLALHSSKDIIILVDEGETGFHPQWQKEYLNNILNFFPQIFPDKKIQLILTSHSPFLASDLPNSNIIFLEKGEDGNCIVKDSLNEMKETFGANIHTLLTDSFFMEGGLIGEFAKKKMNEVIKYLNDESSEIKDIETAEKYIKLIGEPIIRNQLQKRLDSKRLTKVDEIDSIKSQIEDLQIRLKNLEDDSD